MVISRYWVGWRQWASGLGSALGSAHYAMALSVRSYLSRFSHLSFLHRVILAFAWCIVPARLAVAADVYLVPISATVPYAGAGDEIIIAKSGTVTLEIKVGGWSPHQLRTVQARIQSSGYTSGSGGTLSPAGALIDRLRPDYVHFDFSTVTGVDTSGPNYKYGTSTISSDGPLDDGALKYVGTLKLSTSPDANGTFTVGFVLGSSDTYLRDELNQEIMPLTTHSAKITIRPRIYVDRNASGANTGLTWIDAYADLQDALDGVTVGREIWVAAGAYKPDRGVGITPGDRTATFQLISGVALFGGFNGTETLLSQRNPSLNTTILSGEIEVPGIGDNSYHVVTGGGTNSTAILDGFTVTKGNANDGNFPNSYGGGMYNANSSPTLINCTFSENSALGGGGIYNSSNSSPTVTNCTFSGNSSNGSAGGMFNSGNSNPTVTNCTFSGNSALTAAGGGMFNSGVSPKVINCTFSGNSAALWGGGIANLSISSTTVTNCIFSGNSAGNNGGGMYNDFSSPAVSNCTFSGNTAGIDGGGMRNQSSSPTLTNCILWGNSDSGGMDESAQIHTLSGTPVVNYSIVQGGWTGAGGTGVVNDDPLYFDPDGVDNAIGTIDDNLRLRTGSPAIDTGNNASVPADTLDLDGDLNVAEPIPFDLAGNARFVGTVDMGAYEYFPDCNNNGIDDAIEMAACACDVACDCNCNFVLDECEMAACSPTSPDYPHCDDCNLNGARDDCDIVFLTSADTDMNFVPDECQIFTGACFPPSNDWTCSGNWNLGGLYPDNNHSASGIAVILDNGVMVLLNDDVTIPSLIVRPGAQLDITQAGPQGNLEFSSPAQLLIEGTVLVSGAHTIGAGGVPPDVTIGPGGVYQADPGAVGIVSASLTAATIAVVGNDCFVEPCAHGGEMDLSSAMTVSSLGDFVIDGTLANGQCDLGGAAAAALSFHTPPIVRVVNAASIIVLGSVTVHGAAAFLNTSTLGVTVAGDWDNQSVRPNCFDSLAGIITLNGSSPQTFEVGATDVGPVDAVSTQPFAIGTLHIGDGANVTFVDGFDNDLSGQPSCGEAQYVGTLTIGANATVTFDHCRVYYETLIKDPSAQVIIAGCGELREAKDPAAVASDPNGLSKSRMISCTPPSLPIAGPASPTAIRVNLTSLHHVAPPYTNGASIAFTAFEGQSQYVGPPALYIESESTLTPFLASKLQCDPHYQDWSTVGLLHVTGEAITPSSSYQVENLAASCLGNETTCTAVSALLTIVTARWGDAEIVYQDPNLAASQPDFDDIGSLVNKFKSLVGAPIKARAKLAGVDARGLMDITPDVGFDDIPLCVDAFRGVPYPYKPGKCTGAPATACKDNADCGANGPCILCP